MPHFHLHPHSIRPALQMMGNPQMLGMFNSLMRQPGFMDSIIQMSPQLRQVRLLASCLSMRP